MKVPSVKASVEDIVEVAFAEASAEAFMGASVEVAPIASVEAFMEASVEVASVEASVEAFMEASTV